LRIPPVLVYLAGLAAAIAPADHDKQQQQQRQQVFERLQVVYHRQVDSGSKDHDDEDSESSKNRNKSKQQPQRLLVLSPTLLPAPQWQHKIAQQLQQRKIELQVQSQKLAQQLAVLQQQQQQQQSKQKRGTRRTTANPTIKRGPHKTQREQHGSKENSKDDDVDSSSSSSDEDENLVVAVAESTEKDENRSPSYDLLDDLNQEDDDDDDNDWTPVNRKCSSKSTAKATSKTDAPPVAVESESPNPLCDKEEPTANEIADPANSKNDSIVTTNVSNEDDALADPTSSNAAETAATATATASATLSATTTTTDKPKMQELQSSASSLEQVRQLQDRVQQLETQLAAAQQQLMDERNQDDAALQAVQLRLYIAETRLQTYEDALEDHNRQVAHNVAPPSPERDTKRYSRVLQNQI